MATDFSVKGSIVAVMGLTKVIDLINWQRVVIIPELCFSRNTMELLEMLSITCLLLFLMESVLVYLASMVIAFIVVCHKCSYNRDGLF